MDEWMDGWVDGWMGGWMDRWMDAADVQRFMWIQLFSASG